MKIKQWLLRLCMSNYVFELDMWKEEKMKYVKHIHIMRKIIPCWYKEWNDVKKIYKPKVNDEIITNDIISIINEEMKNGESGIDSLKEHSA